jgi:hypothetical protein
MFTDRAVGMILRHSFRNSCHLFIQDDFVKRICRVKYRGQGRTQVGVGGGQLQPNINQNLKKCFVDTISDVLRQYPSAEISYGNQLMITTLELKKK